MTLKQLYETIDGDYDSALRVMRIDKLIDKHIRKLPQNPIFADFAEAGKALDGARIFESAHAIKGVCSNLGLIKLAALSSDVCEEFRPGSVRKLTDGEVLEKVGEIGALYEKAASGIEKYEREAQ